MTNHPAEQSSSWIFFCWAAFAAAVVAMAIAVAYMPMENWLRGYLGVASLLLVQSSFTLAKTLRDQHESSRARHDALKEIL